LNNNKAIIADKVFFKMSESGDSWVEIKGMDKKDIQDYRLFLKEKNDLIELGFRIYLDVEVNEDSLKPKNIGLEPLGKRPFVVTKDSILNLRKTMFSSKIETGCCGG
jgi:hypothetical protein